MKNLMAALSAFQLECPIIHKDTQGHKYTYADLPKIYSVINPLLHKHGLVVSQPLMNGCIENVQLTQDVSFAKSDAKTHFGNCEIFLETLESSPS